jgi:hypothetical protein
LNPSLQADKLNLQLRKFFLEFLAAETLVEIVGRAWRLATAGYESRRTINTRVAPIITPAPRPGPGMYARKRTKNLEASWTGTGLFAAR